MPSYGETEEERAQRIRERRDEAIKHVAMTPGQAATLRPLTRMREGATPPSPPREERTVNDSEFSMILGPWTRRELVAILTESEDYESDVVGAVMGWTDKELGDAFDKATGLVCDEIASPLLDYLVRAIKEEIVGPSHAR